jgi:hypothetical protein
MRQEVAVSDHPATRRTRSKRDRVARTGKRNGQPEPDPLTEFLTFGDPILVDEAVRNFSAYLEILREWDQRQRAELDEPNTERRVIVQGRADAVDSYEEIRKR